MSKRQKRKDHRNLIGSVLAVAFVFTAAVSGLQSSVDSDNLKADFMCNGTLVPDGTQCTPTDGGMTGGTGGTHPAGDSGSTMISCQALNSQQVTTAVCNDADSRKNACVSPSTWNGSGSGTCTAGTAGTGTTGGSASSYVTQPTCQSAGFFWYNNVCNSAVQTVGSCTSGQYWDAASSTCKTSTAGTGTGTASSYTSQSACTGANFFWYNNVCNSAVQTVGSCTSGQYWDAASSTCKTSTAGTGTGTASSYTSQSACTGANFFWYNNVCNSAVQTVGSCSSTQYWDAASSTCKTSGSTPDGTTMTTDQMKAECTSAGGTWNTAASYCDMAGTTANTTAGQCSQGQYWDWAANTCKTSTYYQTVDTATQMKDPAYYGRTGDKAGCESNGWYWDSRGHGGTGDCFPSAPTASQIMTRTTDTSQQIYKIEYAEDDTSFDFFDDFKEGEGQASERDRELLVNLQDEIDFVTAKTGGAYCPGIEKAKEVYAKAYENPSFLVSIGREMPKIFGALHQCEGKIQVLQNLDMLSKELGRLKVAEDKAEAKANLTAKVAAYQADPTTLLDFQAGPDKMRQLWESFEMLRGDARQFQADMGPCSQLEYMKSDIERWQSGDAEGMEGAPEMDEKSLEMAGKGLTIITDALAKNDKNACKKAMREMERMGSELGMDDSGFQVYDQDQMMLQNIYGDEFDLSSLKAELLEELKAELLGSIKKMIQEQITSIVKEQLQIAFADLETRIAESVILSQVTAQMNTVGAKLASDVQDEMNTVFAERLSYYPPDFHEEAEANRETAGELLEPIFENVPEDLIKEAGLDDAAEIIYTELLPENVAEDIADPELMLEVENTIASCIDEDGEVIEGKKETLVRMLEEVAEHVDEQTATLAADQKTAGLAPVENFTDADQIPDWGKTALEGAIFAGEQSCEPVIKGEGDGSMNSGGALLGAHVIVMMDRILCTEGNKSEVADLTNIDWAQEGSAALKDLGVIDDSDIRNMGEVYDRGSTVTTVVKAMGAANPEVQEAIGDTPWVLSKGGLTRDEAIAEFGSVENAEAANFAYATGMMTGQTRDDGTKDLDFDGEFNRLQSVKVSAVAIGVMNTVESQGADTLLETIEAHFAEVIE